MSIVIGSARIDENGKATGGKAGDQKQVSTTDYKGEVSLQAFYNNSKGWVVIRPKSLQHAAKIASAMKTACNNKNIGYSQSERYGVIKAGVATKTATNADCSSLVRACVINATAKDPGDFNTVNEKTVLEKTGLFEEAFDFVSQAKTPLYNGDILVTKTKGHTVIVVSGSPRKEEETAPVVEKAVTAIVNTKAAPLCLRNEKAAQIGVIPKGAKVTVTKKSAATMDVKGNKEVMAKIEYGDRKGYVAQRLLKF